MIKECRNQEELQKCLDAQKPEQWYYDFCLDREEFYQEEMKVPFCILGESGLQYYLALDFAVEDYDQLELGLIH